jgi:hypothetical protein
MPDDLENPLAKRCSPFFEEDALPPQSGIGVLSVRHLGQRYLLSGVRNHFSRRRQKVVQVLEWTARCPDCGAAFSVVTPCRIRTGTFVHANRRCADCARPGKPVRIRPSFFCPEEEA